MYYYVTGRRVRTTHCCSGKLVSITYSECLFVSFDIQHAERMHRVMSSFLACLNLPHFPKFPHQTYDFLEYLIENKTVLWYSLQISVTFLILRRIKRNKDNGKEVPLRAWSSSDVSRKLRFPDYVITAQDVGKVVNLMHRPPLPPENTPGIHFC